MAEVDRLFLTEEARELYSKFTLKPEKSMMVVGSQIGDASLLINKKDRIPNFYENHSPKQLEYLKWKAAMFGKPDGVKFRVMSHGYLKGKSVPYFQIRDKAFVDFERMFYIRTESGRRKKIITNETLELLVGSPLALAVLYQDDGEYNVYSNQAIIHTSDFTIEENNMMAKRFQQLLGPPVRVHMKCKRYPIYKQYPKLALSERATDAFIEIIKPFIHPTMYKKIDQDISHHLNSPFVDKIHKEYLGYIKKSAIQLSVETGWSVNKIYVVAHRLRHNKRITDIMTDALYPQLIRANYHPIRHRYRPFTEEHKRYIIENYNMISTQELAIKLSTSTTYLKKLIAQLGLN